MSEENGNGADVEATIAGQQVRVRNIKSLNTLATVSTLIVSICGFTIGWFIFDAHSKDTGKKDDALIVVLKDLAKSHRDAAREQVKEQRVLNCLISTDQKDRRRAYEDCERIAR